MDLSRKRLDWQALLACGERAAVGAVPPDADGLAGLVRRLGDAEVLAVIESMSGARFVHDQLERGGWDVRVADAVEVRGLAPLACKTDRIDSWVLAELARRDLVPEVWLPDLEVRGERELARFRLHLVKQRRALKNRVHATLFQHGVPAGSSDLFGARGRRLLERLGLPEPWRSTLAATLALIDDVDEQIDACERELRRRGAEHRYVPLLLSCPGIAWVLAFTIAAEFGDIGRFPTPTKLVGYTGLCPQVDQSGEPARPAAQERPRPSPLGADRGGARRRPLPRPLPRAREPQARPARPHTRRQGRRDRNRPQADRGDLAHAHPQPALRSGRRRDAFGRLTAP